MVKKKYYTKDIGVKEERRTITEAGEDVPQTMSEMTNENGVIPVQIDNKMAIQTVSKSMYADPIAGIREYVNNEARPCREAVSKGYEDVSIYITVDAGTRNITIEGRNSMGMTLEIFKKIYTVLGRSGNFDGEESGQFGLGRASYLCLSDLMVFETWSRETNEKFGFVGKNVVAFEPIPLKKLSIKQYGTKITMNMRKDVNLTRIISYIQDISRFLRVDVFLEIVGIIEDRVAYDADLNTNPGVQKVGPVSLVDALVECPAVHIDNDDYELVGTTAHNYYNDGWQYRLIGMPIDAKDRFKVDCVNVLPHCIVNIKNERKYMPVSSRDALTAESNKILHNKIANDLAEHFGKINITHIHDIYENAHIINRVCNIYTNLVKYGFNTSVIQFRKLTHTEFKRVNKSKLKHDKWLERYNTVVFGEIVFNVKSIDSILTEPTFKSDIYYMNDLSPPKINVFLKLNPDAEIISPDGTYSENISTVNLLKRYGIRSVEECLESASITVESADVTDGGIIPCTTDTLISDLDGETTVKLPVQPQIWLPAVRHASLSNIGFVKDSKILDGVGYTLEESCSIANKTIYETSEGMLSGMEILDKYFDGLIVYWIEDERKSSSKTGDMKGSSNKVNYVTLSKCKEYVCADIALKFEPDDMMKMRRLMLAYAERFERPDGMHKYDTYEICGSLSDIHSTLNVQCYVKEGRHANMFDVICRRSQCIVNGVMRDTVGIDVDGVWKNVHGITRDMSQIQSIPVRVLYARTLNTAHEMLEQTIHPDIVNLRDEIPNNRSLEKYADDVEEMILEIDRRASDKNLMELCTMLIQEYRHGDEYYDPVSMNAVYDAAFDYLIHTKDSGGETEFDKASDILSIIFGDTKSPHYISEDIFCGVLSDSSIYVTFNTEYGNATLDDDCMLLYIMHKIFPDMRFDKIKSVTISAGEVNVIF